MIFKNMFLTKKKRKLMPGAPDRKIVLVFGLGNPGRQYTRSRHNIGRETVNYFAGQLEEEFQYAPKLKAYFLKARLGKLQVVLAKSELFMNESGYSLRLLKDYYKIAPDNIWVIHDDVDIPFGKIKSSYGRGAAGHHGVESVIQHLGTADFHRIRIGVWNRPFSEKNKNITQSYVMQNFTSEEESKLKELKEKAVLLLKTAFSNEDM